MHQTIIYFSLSYNPSRVQESKDQLQYLLSKGFISLSVSPWEEPILL